MSTNWSLDQNRWTGHRKPHDPDRVFEDEAKDGGSRTRRFIVWCRIVHGHPRRPGVQRPRPGRKTGNAKAPVTVNSECPECNAFEHGMKDGAPEIPANDMKGRSTRTSRLLPAVSANL